ncbi:hypothetical protein ACQP3J_25030, partial [Escherichia coli]
MSKLKNEPLVRVSEEDGIEIRKIQYPDNTIERIYKQKGVILPRIPLKGRFVEQYVALQLLGFAPIFPDTCYHLTHYWPAAADIPV